MGSCECRILHRTLQPLFLSGFTLKPICGALTSQPLSGTTVIELCNNLGVDNLCWSSHNNLLMSTWHMTRWHIYLYGGQLMIVPGHGYRCGNQPMKELKDQHMADPDSEDQPLNTSDQWVDAFCDESQSSSYHLDMGGSSSYHPNMSCLSSYHLDMGGSSSYHSDIGGLSLFHPEQPPILFDIFGNNMYSTLPQATFHPAADPPDVYSTPQHPPDNEGS
ncbi:hypothetical protein GOBAR_DD07106 [Gossypium barbadense]|nr:hypothetical protein GOBAR_DD07106 [Gossypium barbadense]